MDMKQMKSMKKVREKVRKKESLKGREARSQGYQNS
jgi:hypothetical protein